MYTNYKIARNMSWKVLLDVGIDCLPVRLSAIAKYYNIQVLSYADSNQAYNLDDGFSTIIHGKKIIYFNETKPKTRMRFTIAHELGHCLLGHLSEGKTTNRHNNETDVYTDPKEIQANVFARDLLMPATVLHSLNVRSSEDIMDICNVSRQSAEIRYKRLLELNKRGMYNKHPLERRVYEQFANYINNHKL